MGRGWFAEGVERQVVSGVETLFWSDLWLGGVPLSVRYPRLFDLSLHMMSTVAEMSGLRWEVGGAAWAWEEEILRECRNLLSDLVLQSHVADQWLCGMIWRVAIQFGAHIFCLLVRRSRMRWQQQL
jgi:hypothetical protein